MAGRPLATAFVRIKTLIDSSQVKRDTDAALQGAGLDKAGQEQGKKLGTGMATGLRGSSRQISAGLDDATKDGLKKLQDQMVSGMGKAGTDAGNLAGKSFSDRISEVTKRAATIKIGAEDKSAQATMLRLTAKLLDLSRKTADPEISLQGKDRALAGILEVDVALDKLSKKTARPSIAQTAGAIGSGIGGIGLVGAAAALTPAIATAGLAAGGAALGLGGAAAAGAGALAAFGAVAKPVLTDALKGEQGVEKAQNAYNAAIASGAKKAVAYRAEQRAIGVAYAELSPQQIALSKQLGNMADAWSNVKAKETPVIAGALQPWLRSVTDLTGKLAPIIAAVGPVIGTLGVQMDHLINSPAFTKFREFVAGTGSKAVGAAGKDVIDFFRAVIVLLPQFNPLIQSAIGWVGRLGPSLDKWASSKKTADDITAFMDWFRQNGPVVGTFLKNLAAALAKLAPGLTAGGTLELRLISDFLGLIAKLPPAAASAVASGILGIVVAVKAWGVVQKILDAELLANPIGLIVVALAAVALGFYEAWKKSATFRDIVKSVAAAFLGAGIQIVQSAKLLADGVLNAFSLIVHGVAAAFGWMPGIGPKLKEQAKSWDSFRGSVDGSFNSIIGTMQGWVKKLGDSQVISRDTANKISADFTRQAKAATAARGDVDTYSKAIHDNGVNSDQAKAARNQLITDMISAGVKASTAKADVKTYSAAIHDNGVTSDAAKAARAKLISDILAASGNARQGKTDLNNLTAAVRNHGTTSDAYRNARAKLIADLERAGVSAKGATRLVDGLTGSIKNIPGSKNVHIVMQGDGSYRITGLGPRAIRGGPAQLKPLAAGGRVPGSGTGDTVPAMLTPGEVVVPVSMVKAGAVDHLRGQLPGFASGGLVLQGNQGVLTGSGVAPMYKDFETHFGQAMLNRMYATLKTAEKAAIAARAAAQAATSGIGGSYGDSGARSASAAIAQAFARSIMPQFGWPASMWPAWQALGNEESGWNAYAVNASSGAYGIGQALGHGHPYNLGDYKTQVIWMADYIRSRYGNPVKAYAFENSHSPAWYSKGGLVPPARGYAGGGLITEPIAGVGLRTGTPYSFGERGREWVVPDSGRRPGNGRTGPLVQTGDLYVREAADVDLIAQRLAFSLGVS